MEPRPGKGTSLDAAAWRRPEPQQTIREDTLSNTLVTPEPSLPAEAQTIVWEQTIGENNKPIFQTTDARGGVFTINYDRPDEYGFPRKTYRPPRRNSSVG